MSLPATRPLIAAIITAGCLAGTPAQASDPFPFGRELLLDTAPMRGSKRIPGLDIAQDGSVTIDLWCKSVPGQMIVAGNTITIIADIAPERACPPERARGDDDLLDALSQVTQWRVDGHALILTGGRTLRYRFQTN